MIRRRLIAFVNERSEHFGDGARWFGAAVAWIALRHIRGKFADDKFLQNVRGRGRSDPDERVFKR